MQKSSFDTSDSEQEDALVSSASTFLSIQDGSSVIATLSSNNELIDGGEFALALMKSSTTTIDNYNLYPKEKGFEKYGQSLLGTSLLQPPVAPIVRRRPCGCECGGFIWIVIIMSGFFVVMCPLILYFYYIKDYYS
jgi:hypothetical protein